MNTSRLYYATFFIFILGTIIACSHSYTKSKTVTRAAAYPDAIEKARKDQRYMVMQSGINLYTVKSVDLDQPKQEMTVTLDKVDTSRYAGAKNFGNKRYKLLEGEAPLSSQLLFYMTDSTSYTLDEPHTIPMSKVGRISVIN